MAREPVSAARGYSATELSRDRLRQAYRTMLLARGLDDKEIQLKNQSAIYFQISGAGHEAIQVAVGLHLRPGYDWIVPYYRDRALCLALGVTADSMLLGSFGADSDPSSGGRQMPSHWSSRDLHIVSPSSATGTQCLHAIGCAEGGRLARRLQLAASASESHEDEVVLVSLGDGATSEGEFWESINAACLQHLPVVFLIQDNGYAISVPVEFQTPGGDISRLVEAFPSMHIGRTDGTDLIEAYAVAGRAIAHARSGGGPALIHARVIRRYSHSLSDDDSAYRTVAERRAEAQRDPLLKLRQRLEHGGLASAAELDALGKDVDREIREAADRASRARKPSGDTAARYLYSPDVDPAGSSFESVLAPTGEPATLVATINRTLKDEMERDPRVVVFGQDVADCSREDALREVPGKGGVFKVTHGLQRSFGSDRVFNTPLAEANIVGRALGMALRGLKPVVEIQFFDYVWTAMMQLRNEVAMMRYRSNNAYSCPMVIRLPIGGYLRGGALYHSQSGESIFAHCPGLRIAFPSDAADAVGLLRTAIRADDPILFLEHKHLYRQTYNKAPYPGADYTLPFGKSVVRRDGADAVVITWGALVQRSLVAAQQAERDGISVMVVDMRTIAPYDWDGVAEATRRTNRVIVAHEDQLTCGFGAELAARIADELFDHLDAPIKRVGAMDCPVAYHPTLEERILPQAADVLRAIRDVVAY